MKTASVKSAAVLRFIGILAVLVLSACSAAPKEASKSGVTELKVQMSSTVAGEREVFGTIESINGDILVIDGVTLKVSRSTEMKDMLAVGDQVKAHVSSLPDGSLLAREIEKQASAVGTPSPAGTDDSIETPEASETPDLSETPEPSETPEVSVTPDDHGSGDDDLYDDHGGDDNSGDDNSGSDDNSGHGSDDNPGSDDNSTSSLLTWFFSL